MGSPVSVDIATLVMEDVETRALTTPEKPLRFWKRYVDDVFYVVSKDLVLEVLHHINSIEPLIQFMCEVEDKDRCFPFLDAMRERCDDGSVLTYEAYTFGPLHRFTSHHPHTQGCSG